MPINAQTGGGAPAPLNIPTEAADYQFDLIRSAYAIEEDDQPNASVDKFGPVPGVRSIFNPFNVFRYHKFGTTGTYAKDLHFDSPIDPGRSTNMQLASLAGLTTSTGGDNPQLSDDGIDQLRGEFRAFDDIKRWIENPSASQIIEWSKLQTAEGVDGNAITPTPYAASDFLWCKYYGKVPNNRMVTLRRYPIPVEDNILISAEKSPLVPISQAVTWFGQDINNPLSQILNLGWGLNWTEKTAGTFDIAGNEITVEQLTAAAGLSGPEAGELTQLLKTYGFSDNGKVDLLKLSGFDTSIQGYIRDAYNDGGPYWNRVLGPVNVINKTAIRDRGFKDQQPIQIVFEYSLRSYSGVNPKIAFLDLLTNFLSLTLNTAPFWGGGARYFQKTGVTIPALGMEQAMLEGDAIKAIQSGLAQLTTTLGRNIGALKKVAEGLAQGDQKASSDASQQLAKLLAPRIGQILQQPLSFRSIIDGRAIGEWHLTVGNPMNPIATIGNLYVDSVKMDVAEVLGVDDFPTEFKFTVTLKHGRPRAKQDIESIFNLGNGSMTFSELPQPSSGFNSYGDTNTARQNNYLPGSASVDDSRLDIVTGNSVVPVASNSGQGASTGNSQVSNQGGGSDEFTKAADRYRSRVTELYGEGFGRSPSLIDYFKELKTKD